MRDFLKQYIWTRMFGERLVSVLTIIVIILVARDFAIFFLTAFLCAYLFREAEKWLGFHLKLFAKKSPKQLQPSILWLAKEKVLLTILYLFFAFICIFAIRDIGPTLTSDMINLLQSLSQRF